MKLAVIGALCRDRIVYGKAPPVSRAGGGVLYAAQALASLGCMAFAVPLLSAADDDLLAALSDASIDVRPSWTAVTTEIELVYPEGTSDDRTVRIVAAVQDASPDLSILAGLAGPDAPLGVHFAPLTPREFCRGFFAHCRAVFSGVVCLDAQGLVRGSPFDYEAEIAHHVDILKVDEEEALRLSGLVDVDRAASRFSAWGIAEVVVTRGSRGSTIYADGERYSIAAVAPASIVDATGCGDTYIAAYLAGRISGVAPREAGTEASAVAAKKLSYQGPLRR
ncbi:MAG: PfkB family carbohydrate kinase [Acidobacteriota bacterium]